MIKAIRKKKFSRLRRLLSCSEDRKKKRNDNCGETDSSSENNQNKAQNNSVAKGKIPSTPGKASRRSPPSTPSTLPDTSTPQKNTNRTTSKDGAFVITYNDHLPTGGGYGNKNEERPCIGSIPDENNNNNSSSSLKRKQQQIATALEVDRCQLVISTEDDIESLFRDSIDLDQVNRQLFQQLEESQKDVLASIVHPETTVKDTAAVDEKKAAFTTIPDHPALGNLEKYRSGLNAAGSSPSKSTTTANNRGGVVQQNSSSYAEESDNLDKGSVSEGLKSLWDETTKNLESMNKVFSNCALDWKQETQESFAEFAYNGERNNAPLTGEWLAVPDTQHREDISLLTNPRDIASVSSRWTESQLDGGGGIPILRKQTTTPIVEEDDDEPPIHENPRSRYNRWL
ncbi:MAG: hypothetical protein SGBAC_001211 [Bacillariaceae sp.]